MFGPATNRRRKEIKISRNFNSSSLKIQKKRSTILPSYYSSLFFIIIFSIFSLSQNNLQDILVSANGNEFNEIWALSPLRLQLQQSHPSHPQLPPKSAIEDKTSSLALVVIPTTNQTHNDDFISSPETEPIKNTEFVSPIPENNGNNDNHPEIIEKFVGEIEEDDKNIDHHDEDEDEDIEESEEGHKNNSDGHHHDSIVDANSWPNSTSRLKREVFRGQNYHYQRGYELSRLRFENRLRSDPNAVQPKAFFVREYHQGRDVPRELLRLTQADQLLERPSTTSAPTMVQQPTMSSPTSSSGDDSMKTMSDFQQQLFATKAALKAAIQRGDKDFSILDYLNKMKARIDAASQKQQHGSGDGSGHMDHNIFQDVQIKDTDAASRHGAGHGAGSFGGAGGGQDGSGAGHGGFGGGPGDGNLGVRFDEQIKEDLSKILPYDPSKQFGERLRPYRPSHPGAGSGLGPGSDGGSSGFGPGAGSRTGAASGGARTPAEEYLNKIRRLYPHLFPGQTGQGIPASRPGGSSGGPGGLSAPYATGGPSGGGGGSGPGGPFGGGGSGGPFGGAGGGSSPGTPFGGGGSGSGGPFDGGARRPGGPGAGGGGSGPFGPSGSGGGGTGPGGPFGGGGGTGPGGPFGGGGGSGPGGPYGGSGGGAGPGGPLGGGGSGGAGGGSGPGGPYGGGSGGGGSGPRGPYGPVGGVPGLGGGIPYITPIGNRTGIYPPGTLGTPASAYPSRFPGRLLSALTLYPGIRNSTFPGFPGYIRLDYPGYNTVPYTGFRCDIQPYRIGYYADVAAGCQVFHICQRDGRMDSFLCPNGTLFHQKVMTCDWWYLVNCPASPSYYYLNGRIGVLPPLPATLSRFD